MATTVFSYGGGVQSTAALVLAAQGELRVDAFLFANVGNDSENPATLRYIAEHARPFAQRHGITLTDVQRRNKSGEIETLYQWLMRPNSRTIGIPVRLAGSGAPANRACTQRYKIQMIANWCWKNGARAKNPATTMLGISLDEFQRMRSDSGYSYTRLAYPLIERRMSRQDCINVIVRAGLPVPSKSSCWFCPYHRLSAWREQRDHEPKLFAQSVQLEQTLMARLRAISKRPNDGCYLTTAMKPLPLEVGEASQPSLFGNEQSDDATCDSNFCFT